MSYLLKVNDISVEYNQVVAVNQVNLELKQGQIVTVIGANGAGKSSLMNAIMGNLPIYGKVNGEILFKKENLNRRKAEYRVSQGLSLVPESRELFTSMTVQDNLMLGGYRRYRAKEQNWQNFIEEIYTLFPRLKERRKQLAGTLSGGERQMLALGRALMAKPDLLMLDEPSLGLAPLVVKEIFQTIQELQKTGVSILLVEQNARAALQIADYAYVLEMGEVKIEGVASELMNHPGVVESYLGFKAS